MNCLDTALFLLRDFLLWPVVIYPPGVQRGNEVTKGKEPIGESWGSTRPTEQAIREMFHRFPDAGVGLLLGPDGGIVDIDCDGPGWEESLAKLMGGEIVRTLGWSSRRGPHLVYRFDARLAKYGKSVIKNIPELPGLEIRIGATGKQLQSNCPPTIGEDGQPREWNGCDVIADVPEAAVTFLDAALAKPEHKAALIPAHAPTTVEERARKYARTIDPAVSGERGHDKTFYAACKLGPGFDLARELALRILREEFNPRCQPPWTEKDLEHKVDDAYAKNPSKGWLLGSQNNGRVAGGNGAALVGHDPSGARAGGKILVSSRGAMISCQTNAKTLLVQRGTVIRHDRFQRALLIDDQVIDDELVVQITGELEDSTGIRWVQEHVRSAIIDLGRENQFSSLTTWLDSLKWDGEHRLNTFFNEAYGIAHDTYGAECARVLFLSAVARAYQPGCQADVMVVLIGPQGIGKSMGIASLCPHPDWYSDDLGCDLFASRSAEGLQGKWLFEFSEFARINRATLDIVKSFITRRVDRYRVAYGRTTKDYPRTCVFVGTTNDQQPLHDVQNRRFMTIRVGHGDVAWIVAHRDQLWAEAVSRYQGGEKHWVTDPAMIEECISRQEESQFVDAWQEILAERLTGYENITVPRAAELLDIKPDRLDRSAMTRIGIALQQIGFKRRRVRDGQKLGWVYERGLFPP